MSVCRVFQKAEVVCVGERSREEDVAGAVQEDG